MSRLASTLGQRYLAALALPPSWTREQRIDELVRQERLKKLCLRCGTYYNDRDSHVVNFCGEIA